MALILLTVLLWPAPGLTQEPQSPAGGTTRTPNGHDAAINAPKEEASTSLEAILAYAEQHAPSLLVARERLGLGDATLAAASPVLPDNPEISFGVGPGINDPTHIDFTASVSQRLEIAGERGLRIDEAHRTQARLRAELAEVRWRVHRDVHAAFHRALVARDRQLAATRLLVFQQRLLEIARSRLRAGDVAPLAVRLAEGELSQARVREIEADQDYLRARLQLGALAGWPAGRAPEPLGALDAPRDPPSAALLLRRAREQQPRLRTLQARQAEARARRLVEEREVWPEPTVGVQLTRERLPQGPPETQVLGVLSVPLPIARRNAGPRLAAAAQTRIALAEVRAFEIRLQARIEQHRSAVLAAAAQLRTYGSEILPTFEENLRLIRKAFELGEIDILQVSVAREQFLRIQSDALDAYERYFLAIADLEGAIGADLWEEEHHDHAAKDSPDEEEHP